MFTHKINKLPKKTLEIVVKIPWTQIGQEYDIAFDLLHKDFASEGFRKGKVPKEIAEKHIAREAIYNQLLRTLLPKIYEEIVKKEDLKPISSPKIELVQAKENEEWEVKFITAEKPEIKLGDYKEAIKKAKEEAKKPTILLPGQEDNPVQNAEQQKQASLQATLTALLKSATCEIPDVIIEEEVNNRLARLLDDIQKIGLTADAYLQSKNTNMDELKKNITQEIEETYKMEFILQEIADTENIAVEKDDLEQLFTHIKDEKERAAAEQNAYFYASIMRKQKVLEYLNSL